MQQEQSRFSCALFFGFSEALMKLLVVSFGILISTQAFAEENRNYAKGSVYSIMDGKIEMLDATLKSDVATNTYSLQVGEYLYPARLIVERNLSAHNQISLGFTKVTEEGETYAFLASGLEFSNPETAIFQGTVHKQLCDKSLTAEACLEDAGKKWEKGNKKDSRFCGLFQLRREAVAEPAPVPPAGVN